MSEADTPTPSSGLPESVESAAADSPVVDRDASHPSPPSSDAEWQTVDFPGALPVDTLTLSEQVPDAVVLDEPSAAASHEISSLQVAASNSDWTPLIEQLREANTALRSHIVQLENDLTQGQIELQLEKARSLDREATHADQLNAQAAKCAQELAIAQEHVSRITQELDLSHQAAQRQQILVETLTEQLDSSQERIAQLERDCAITQQRYNEQIQQRLQAESACRDLRMRLHRQQQHTLQFKVALEKCLEMPNAQVQPVLSANFTAIESSEDLEASVTDDSTPLLGLKHQPVKPWSAPQGAAEAPFKFASPLSKPLSTPEAAPAQELPDRPDSQPADVEVHSQAPAPDSVTARGESFQQISNLMNLIFTEDADNSRYQAEDVQPEGEIFDISPFLEVGAIEPDESSKQVTSALSEQVEPSVASPNSTAITVSEAASLYQEAGDDPVWADLAKLIDSSTARRATDSTTVIPAEDSSPDLPPDLPADDRLLEAESTEEAPALDESRLPLRETAKQSPSIVPEIAAVDPVHETRSLPYASTQALPQGAFNPFDLGSSQPTPASDAAVRDMTELPASWPSPIVYPTRPAKKLKSLAAVELPMFPRAKQG